MEKQHPVTELQITSREGTINISGDLPDLHGDPSRVHKLLDSLDLPRGTEVRVVTKSASVIVR
jgi:hypothetical protein